MRIKKGSFGKKKGFIVQSLFLIFYFLERISLFFWIREIASKRFEKKNVGCSEDKRPFVKTVIFPELWVVGNLLFAIIAHYLVRRVNCVWVIYILLAYAIERTIEMFVYQVNVLFFHRLKPVFLEQKPKEAEEYSVKSSTRTVWMLIFNMIEYVLQFAVIFVAVGALRQDSNMNIGLLDSFKLFMNLGGLENYSVGIIMTIAYVETIVGIFMNILCLARFIGELPQTKETGYLDEEMSDIKPDQVWEKMYEAAKKVLGSKVISEYVTSGEVSAAVLSKSGKIYTGVCVDTCSTLGICAERNAIFNMITNGEYEIDRVLCIPPKGGKGAPCGACRELMTQLMPGKYKDIEIMIDYSANRVMTLGELTPEWWID